MTRLSEAQIAALPKALRNNVLGNRKLTPEQAKARRIEFLRKHGANEIADALEAT